MSSRSATGGTPNRLVPSAARTEAEQCWLTGGSLSAKRLSCAVGASLSYVRSESTSASGGGDPCFPLAPELNIVGGFADESFISMDPPSGSAPSYAEHQVCNIEKVESMEVFGTPPVIKTLLDDVDWSLNKEADAHLLRPVLDVTPQHPTTIPFTKKQCLRHSTTTLPIVTREGRSVVNKIGLQCLQELLRHRTDHPNDTMLELNRLLCALQDGTISPDDLDCCKFLDLILVHHLSGQLLQQPSTCHLRKDIAPETGNVSQSTQQICSGLPLSSSIYVFPPPPPSQRWLPETSIEPTPGPVTPTITPTVSIGVDNIFHNLNLGLTELLSQLMTPAMNGFFQQSLPSVSRWRNIDVTFPVVIPAGYMCVSTEQDIQKIDVSYAFENADLQAVFGTSVLGLFSSADASLGGLVPASMLRTRVAVIHKCPDFLVSKIAQLFRELIASQCPLLDEPITLSCTRVSRCSVPLVRPVAGGCLVTTERCECQERIEALVSPATAHDERRLLRVSTVLWSFADVINNRLTKVLSSFYSRIPIPLLQKRSVPEDLYSIQTGKVGLELRFAPSKQMKIVVAQRALHQASGLLVKRVDISGIQLNEIRLEQDRRLDKEWDPLMLECGNYYVPTKRILRDETGFSSGRALLVPKTKVILPKITKMIS